MLMIMLVMMVLRRIIVYGEDDYEMVGLCDVVSRHSLQIVRCSSGACNQMCGLVALSALFLAFRGEREHDALRISEVVSRTVLQMVK